MSPDNKSTKKKKSLKNDFDIDQILLKNRQIHLFGPVDDESCGDIIEKIFILDSINENPIHLYINSTGGDCSSGIAIINAMRSAQSKINTIIIGEACSTAAHIFVEGDCRKCYENSVFMIHDMQMDLDDYSLKIKDRATFIEKYYNLLDNQLKRRTKLTNRDLKLARSGELWLFADEMVKKNVADEIISFVEEDK